MDEFLDELRNDHSDFDNGSINDQLKKVDPIKLFEKWYKEAFDSQCPHPNGMSISTVGKDFMPSARMVYMKELLEEGFIFYTNYKSHKGRDISENPQVTLLFFWEKLSRQIRIQGRAEKTSEHLSDEYFSSRPRESQLGAWASKQSGIIPEESTLEDEVKKMKKRFENQDVTRPPFWGGYLIQPLTIEFWQGKPCRLHDRICFEREEVNNKSWTVTRKYP